MLLAARVRPGLQYGLPGDSKWKVHSLPNEGARRRSRQWNSFTGCVMAMGMKQLCLGDRENPGDFCVMRYRVLIACDVPPHWHPEDEHATVIAGEISLGLGKKFLVEALR